MRKCPIGLDDYDMLDVVIEQAATNKDSFTTSRVEWVFDLALGGMFTDSMSDSRKATAPLSNSPFACRSALPWCAGSNGCRRA